MFVSYEEANRAYTALLNYINKWSILIPNVG